MSAHAASAPTATETSSATAMESTGASTTPVRRPRNTSLITAVLALTGMIVSLQQTLIIPVLPELPGILHTSAEDASWLVTATLLTSAVATPIVSRLADMYGKRKMLFTCLAMQMVGSALGGLGTGLGIVIAGRALQGFAAALIPVGISIMRDELPREKVGGAAALMSATLGIGSATGLPLAGLIYAHASWHYLFWASAAMALVMTVAIARVVPESAVRTPGTFDGVGAMILSIALVSLLLAITKGRSWGWMSESTLVLLVLALVLLAAWVPWELRTRTPMVDLRTAARRPVMLTNLTSLLVGFSMYGNMLTTTQLLQLPEATGFGFGMSVLGAGICMIPSGIAMLVFSPISARITARFGGRVTLLIGAMVMAGAYVCRVLLVSHLWQVVVGALLVSVGTALCYSAMPTLIMSAVPITETASANGFNTLLRSIGTSSSSAAVAALLTSSVIQLGGESLPSLVAFKHIFWLSAAAALAAALVSAFLPAARPAAVTAARRTAQEVVVKGKVSAAGMTAVRGATVTIADLDGEQVDWSRVDADGSYAVVLPGAGRYLAVTAADGWAPHAQLLDITTAGTRDVDMGHRLSVTGRVRRGKEGVEGALVTLTKVAGEVVSSTTTDESGRFAMPLRSQGRHVVTALDPDTGEVRAMNVALQGEEVAVAIELGRAGRRRPIVPPRRGL